MKQKFLNLSKELREKVIKRYLPDFGFFEDDGNMDLTGLIKDYILKAIRSNQYRLNKSDVNDIISSFQLKIKPIIGNFERRFASTAHEKQELQKYYDEMINELADGFSENTDTINVTRKNFINPEFVGEMRLKELMKLNSSCEYDLSKLITACIKPPPLVGEYL